jgi:hypothetical protein
MGREKIREIGAKANEIGERIVPMQDSVGAQPSGFLGKTHEVRHEGASSKRRPF